ncbi:hypothetical protein [Dryocola clanedunensis]|uniref:hypothetical protein n=1 Tax=Cedecea sulfonylureivorans TaxID=3051154 RepID=UPI0019263F6A|nr:hypothetical protein [Cedecea sulfonylureivorans]
MAMLLFIAQLGCNAYDKIRDSSDQTFKLRVIFLSEINNNLLALSTGGDESYALGTVDICIPLPEDDKEAVDKMTFVATNLHDEVYYSQLDKLSFLPKDELNSVVKSYHSLTRLRTLSLELTFIKPLPNNKVKILRSEYNNLYNSLIALSSKFENETKSP